jgi:hypothetical protein
VTVDNDGISGRDFLAGCLEEAQLELERLQSLVAEIPELMEQRFCQELRQMIAVNQALANEQKHLLSQLQKTRVLALPLSAPMSRNRRLVLVCASCVAVAVATVGFIRFREVVETPAKSQPTAQLHASATSGALPVAGSVLSLVELETSEPTWVEIRDQNGQLLFKDTVSGVDHRPIRLRQGLQLFAAKPEMVRFRVDGGPWQSMPQHALQTRVITLLPSTR